jgi:AcrR family transcriptional regulator
LDAAGEAIAEEGVDTLRLDRVARAAGCSRSSLYRYFDTKDELIIAVLARRIEQMSQRISIELADIGDPAEHVVMGVARAVELARSDPHFAVLFSEPNSPTVVRIAGSALPRLLGSLVGSVLPSSEQRGWLPPGVPPEEAARWIVMVTVGLLTFDSERAADREALIEYLGRFLVPSLFRAGSWQRNR